jgi:glycine C-acetyltransferase
MVRAGDDLRARLFDNAKRFRAGMTDAGFDLCCRASTRSFR